MSGGVWLQALGARIALIDSSVFLKNGSLPLFPLIRVGCPPPPFLTSFLFIVFGGGRQRKKGLGGVQVRAPLFEEINCHINSRLL